MSHTFFATTPKGMATLLETELRDLGADGLDTSAGGVSFRGPLSVAYRACLWSRVANRVLLPIATFRAPDPDALYAGVQGIDWSEHMASSGTLAVECAASRSKINHTHYAALKVKDAIVDQFRDAADVRPSVDLLRPDLRVHLYLRDDHARVSIDLAGRSLHQRGYRGRTGTAPLKENLAAAILLSAGWSEIAAAGGELVDPLCGSGTFLVEAAQIAADIAPGLGAGNFGFERWTQHDAESWKGIREDALARREHGLSRLPPISGYDHDVDTLHAAMENIARAGLDGRIHVERRALGAVRPRRPGGPGLLVANPPYGLRLGEGAALTQLYAILGVTAKEHFGGWRTAVFTANESVRTGLRPDRVVALYNGATRCRLSLSEIVAAEDRFVDLEVTPEESWGDGARMLANRLRKNRRVRRKRLKREEIACYRLYDADLPEYAFALDVYQGEQTWAHVEETAPPSSVDPDKAEARRRDALSVIPTVLEIPIEQVHFKMRRRGRGAASHKTMGNPGETHEVGDGPAKLLVNFTDHGDTGLALRHRLAHRWIGDSVRGKRFLNLFGRAGAPTVHAIYGGAVATTTVDRSRDRLAWARRNFHLNGFSGAKHQLIEADCFDWLIMEGRRRRYDVIFLDPPLTVSSPHRKKRFVLERDYPELLQAAVALLAADGELLFASRVRGLSLDADRFAGLSIEDVSRGMLPFDFERRTSDYRAWRIRRG